ncbi:MAG: UpxY family transcription antiterminator [bacterium]|uniref:UpxY family transcription antiterminator n=1 Tax=Candidatus Methylomirabilis tolerans TaxID=3123416 RepID=A0AAJ1EIW6_9BACT|nr:UpxY family transcription antiterminator [Candidatus Methylomirabilis sp.]
MAEELLRRGIEAFVPLREVLSQWKDRKKLVQLPLFPGYIFVHFDQTMRREVLQPVGAISLVGVHGVLTPIPDAQIEAIRTICRTKRPLDLSPYLTEGERIQVVRGPLAGLQGFLSEQEGRQCLVVSIDLLQQSLAVEVDADSVVPIDGHGSQ